jgi:hypothetical protein
MGTPIATDFYWHNLVALKPYSAEDLKKKFAQFFKKVAQTVSKTKKAKYPQQSSI